MIKKISLVKAKEVINNNGKIIKARYGSTYLVQELVIEKGNHFINGVYSYYSTIGYITKEQFRKLINL